MLLFKNEPVLLVEVIFAPYTMHQIKAGKQAKASGIATPSKSIKKIVELKATTAKSVASMPMFLSNGFCFILIPISSRERASDTKKVAEEIK